MSVSPIDLQLSDVPIQAVHVYCNARAELQRTASVELRAGGNLIHVHGIAPCLLEDTVKIAGESEENVMTIQEVLVERVQLAADAGDDDLTRKTAAAKAQVERIKSTRNTLLKYVSNVSPEFSDATKLVEILTMAEDQSTQLHERLFTAEQNLIKLEQQKREQDSVKNANANAKRLKVAIFSENAAKADLVISYATYNASWRPLYDIRVNTESDESPVKVAFKAKVQQSTGELWKDVEVFLETAVPTNNASLPILHPQELSIYTPPKPQTDWGSAKFGSGGAEDAISYSMAAPSPPGSAAPTAVRARRMRVAVAPQATVTQTGTASTFQILGKQTISAAGTEHTLTIADLELDADLERAVVPRHSKVVILRANIKNSSLYTLLAGKTAVYVDGSFVANSSVDSVAPQETFKCNLGSSPSVKVQSHPMTKHAVISGGVFSFAGSRTKATRFTQRYTFTNTASHVIEDLCVYDQIPISTVSNITVKLLQPELPLIDDIDLDEAGERIPCGNNVTCKWASDSDSTEADNQQGAKAGKLQWNIRLGASEKVNVVLEYDVSHPAGDTVIGL